MSARTHPPIERVDAPEAEAQSSRLRVGRFDVLGRVAVGGMSEIFLAQEQVAGEPVRRVAIKLLRPPAHAADLTRVEALFAREGRTLLRLAHPNVCHSYEFGTLANRFFIAMEWVDGVSLRELMLALKARGQKLPIAHAVNLIAQIAAGLQHAHTARDANNQPLRVVHRDVNPTNIMIRYDGVVKLIDFGVAQAAEVAHAPIAELIEGKLSYMAPEQICGESLDARADIFALGICLFEVVAGARLFRRKLPEQVRAAVLLGDVPPASSIDAAVPAQLDAIIQMALQRDPAARFQNACALQTALEDFLVASNLPMGARPLAVLMDELFRDRPLTPELTSSVELMRLAQASTAHRDTRLMEVEAHGTAHAADYQDSPDAAETGGAERSGARAVAARPSDHSALKTPAARVATRRALAGLLAVGAVAVATVGFVVGPADRSKSTPPALASAPVVQTSLPPGAAQLKAAAVAPAEPEPPTREVQAAQPGSAEDSALALPSAEPAIVDEAPTGARSPVLLAIRQTAATVTDVPARALFAQGLSQAAKQQHRAALISFQQADALQPAPAITLHWAITLHALAHFAEAYQRLNGLDRAELGPELAARAASLQAALEAQVTRLSLELPQTDELTVRLDGLHLSRAELTKTRGLTPGRHELELWRGVVRVQRHVLQTQPGEHLHLGAELLLPAAP